LRFIALPLRRTASTPRGTRFARLDLGLFTKSSILMTFYEFSKTRRVAQTGGNRVDDKENRNACQISPAPPVGPRLPDNFVTYFFPDSAAVISVDSTFFLIHTFLRRRRPPAPSGKRLHPTARGAMPAP
jgi:hypothetical protein